SIEIMLPSANFSSTQAVSKLNSQEIARSTLFTSNHPKELQCLCNCRFLFWRTFRLFGIFRLWLIIVLPLNNAILLFDLVDIEMADFQASMLQYIRLDFLIGSLAFRRRQIQFVQIQLHLDMLLGIKFGQKYYRLNIRRSRKHVYCFCFYHLISAFLQYLEVSY